MSDLTQYVLGAGLLALLYSLWGSLSQWRLGRILQVVLAGSVVATLALGLGFFLLNGIKAVLDAMRDHSVAMAAYWLAACAVGFLFYGILLWGVWVAFARYTKQKVGLDIPGAKSRI